MEADVLKSISNFFTSFDVIDKKECLKLINLIISSCKSKKGLYVPKRRTEAEVPQESCSVEEQEHTAFTTWLLGRLFCLYERDDLADIHQSCTLAQIEVVVTCFENQYMKRFFFNEYICCLRDLVEIQSTKSHLTGGPQLLRRFTPLPVPSQNDMNLTPKYTLVSSGTLLKNLIQFVIEILESLVQYVAHTLEDLVIDMWTILCNLLPVATTAMKLRTIRIFCQIVSVVGCHEMHVMQILCSALKCMVQALPYHCAEGKSSVQVQELRFAVGNLLNIIVSSESCFQDEKRDRDLLNVLRSLLSAWDLEGISGPALQTACCNVVSLLHKTPHASSKLYDSNSYIFLLRAVPTQLPAIQIFEELMFSELVEHIQSFQTNHKMAEKGSKSTSPVLNEEIQISALSLPTWNLLHKQLWDDMTSAKCILVENPSGQVWEHLRNLIGKVYVIVRSAVGLDALALHCRKQSFISINFFGNQVGEFLNMLKSTLISCTSFNNTFHGMEGVLKDLFASIANLMLLSEMMNCSENDAKFAVSVLSLPWLEENDVFDLKVNSDLVGLRHVFQRIQGKIDGETLKSISLKVLANVPHGLFPLWRISLFEKIIHQLPKSATEVDVSLAKRAIEIIPCLLMDTCLEPSEIFSRILKPILNSRNDSLLVALSGVFSAIVCVLAGNYVPVSLKSTAGCLMKSLICKTCHKNFCGSKHKAADLLYSFKLELLEFMSILTSPVNAIRYNMVSSLSSLVLHLPTMYQPDILSQWMKYAEDPDEHIRTVFSRMVKFLIFQRGWMEGKEIESENLKEEHIPLTQIDRVELSHSRPRLDRVLHMLFEYINTNLSGPNQDFALQKTVLETIVDIGCVPLDCVLRPVIKIILMCVSHPAFLHPSIAQVYFKQIANAHNTNVSKLYYRFQSEICEVLVLLAGMNFHSRTFWTRYMDRVVYGLGFKSTADWLKESFRHVAPIIFLSVIKLDDERFLDEIINLIKGASTSKQSIVAEYFQYIYPCVFLNEEDEIVEKCVELTERLSGLKSHTLFLKSFRNIHNEFLLHYPSKKKRVEEGISILIKVQENKKANQSRKQHASSSSPNIAEHLAKRFLGILNHFECLLDSPHTEENLKIKALQSLPEIIYLLGSKYITPVRFKVLSTLRTALRLTHCDFPHLSCGAWEAFIKSVDLQVLGPLLGTIAASLLPLLDQYPEETSRMLHWLVVENEQQLSKYIPDLFFLPDNPAIASIHNVVKRHLQRDDEKKNLTDDLQQLLQCVSHDNVDIRKLGLQHLLNLSKTKQEVFLNEFLSKEVVCPTVAKLLNLLVDGCQDPDPDVRLLCVQNLGMLGALDPCHLPHKRPETDMSHVVYVDEDQFGVQALTVLAKGYHAARHTRFLDSFAVAIQELLKHYQISSSLPPKRKLWNTFPHDVQQIMAPLESSSYCMVATNQNNVWPHPIFGTRYAPSLTLWAHTWALRLCDFIEEGSCAKSVFGLCIPSLRADVNCVMFFLPYVLLYAVIYSSDEQRKMISEEISFIIQQWKQSEEGENENLGIPSEELQIRKDRFLTLPKSEDSDRATHALCTKTVFSLLDFLEKWVNRLKKHREIPESHGKSPINQNESILKVEDFIALFPKLELAQGNYGVKEYARALMYLEDFLMNKLESMKSHMYSDDFLMVKQEIIKDHLGFLGRIYAQMNEPEGIKGVLAVQCIQPKLLESVVYHEVTGQYQEALACYELLAKDSDANAFGLHVQLGMVRCCLKLDQPFSALHIAEGVMSKRLEYHNVFLEAQAECFWRMNNFKELEKVVGDPKLEDSVAWGVNVGRCLMDIYHSNDENLAKHLLLTRNSLSKALSAASFEQGSYNGGYSYVVKLHMLQDVESASIVFAQLRVEENEDKCVKALQHLVQVWRKRSDLLQALPGVQEQVLRLHRSLLQLTLSFVRKSQSTLAEVLTKEIGYSWLKSAEVARLNDCYQQAYVYLLHAEKYKPKQHFILLAKLLWQKNSKASALSTLKRGLEEHFPKVQHDFKPDVDDLKICAEAKLLIAVYNDESVNVDIDVSIDNYQKAIKVYGQWETSHANLAAFYDRMTPDPHDRSNRSGEYKHCAVTHYLKSLRFGCCEIYRTMSRLLTIWLDFGNSYQKDLMITNNPQTKSEEHRQTVQKHLWQQKDRLKQMNDCVDTYVNVLPPYMFMVGFSQLLSRICHQMKDVYEVIKKIIAKLVSSYPQQTLWMLLAALRSSHTLRRERCQAVLNDPSVKKTPGLAKLAQDFSKLGTLLVEFTSKPIQSNVSKTTVQELVKELPKLLSQKNFSEIIVPLRNSCTLSLPKLNNGSLDTHMPFPQKIPHIIGIKNDVIILNSLQKPRKITLEGSDGHCYEIMCKKEDDLRLDARVMEFNNIVNNYLQKDPSSRSHNLNIRTYTVVPLSDSSGLIEWVPNLIGYRNIIFQLMKEMGIFTESRMCLKKISQFAKSSPLSDKRKRFIEQLVPHHPPVFRTWFRNNFTDSRSWFEARKSYVQTTAVMSMVGYILGLGDRHGENILVDTTCGDIVHVDFNCLFNRGETFEWPERVPFRLTHNMIYAMGPTGVEGHFRHVCEMTLSLLREQKGTLSSVLQPFVYDPAVTSSRSRREVDLQDEVKNYSAVENVKNIDLRLSGMLMTAKKSCNLELSVEGQTAFLIQEATNVDNLCQMYIGWAAFM